MQKFYTWELIETRPNNSTADVQLAVLFYSRSAGCANYRQE